MTMVVKDPAQIGRNDSIATATPVSNLSLLASLCSYGDGLGFLQDGDVAVALHGTQNLRTRGIARA